MTNQGWELANAKWSFQSWINVLVVKYNKWAFKQLHYNKMKDENLQLSADQVIP